MHSPSIVRLSGFGSTHRSTNDIVSSSPRYRNGDAGIRWVPDTAGAVPRSTITNCLPRLLLVDICPIMGWVVRGGENEGLGGLRLNPSHMEIASPTPSPTIAIATPNGRTTSSSAPLRRRLHCVLISHCRSERHNMRALPIPLNMILMFVSQQLSSAGRRGVG